MTDESRPDQPDRPEPVDRPTRDAMFAAMLSVWHARQSTSAYPQEHVEALLDAALGELALAYERAGMVTNSGQPYRKKQSAHALGQELRAITGELDISPWDALLLEVRRTCYRVAWVDQRVEAELERERQLEPDAGHFHEDVVMVRTEMKRWMAESRNERRHLARVAKAAIDAGIAAHIVRNAELEARTIAWVLGQSLDVLELDDDARGRAALALRRALEDVSTERRGRVIQGELVTGHPDLNGGPGDRDGDGDRP
jgi:hypothetical protein